MAPERIQEREKPIPMLRIEKFETLSIDEVRALGLPAQATQRLFIDAEKNPQNKFSTEFLKASQEDGILSVLACTEITDVKNVHGVIVDILGNQLVGDTSFSGYLGQNAKKEMSVVTTFTHEDLRGVGLAERRLRTINAYCLQKYGIPLSSSYNPSSAAERLWGRLVERGLASVIDTSNRRQKKYRFKQSI